ncbi:MAG: hypothetical protein PF961_18060 [Planctomycetota bacterium]|nr:hypothetical protein [Planctomycetota bacterium]
MASAAAPAAEPSGAAAEAYDRLSTALSAVAQGDRQAERQARSALTTLRSSPDPNAAAWLALARVRWSLYAAGGDDSDHAGAVARKHWEEIIASIGDTASLPVALRLELARCQAAVGDVAGALARFDAIGSAAGGLVQVRAAAGTAGVYREQRRYQDALRWIDFALRCLDHHDRYHESTGLRDELRRERDELRRLRDLLEHGPGFVRYRAARVAWLEGRHAEALERWDGLLAAALENAGNEDLRARFLADPQADEALLEQLPIPKVYQEAARCYRLHALVALGQQREALGDLRRFVAADPGGLYRCEARRLHGDIVFEHQADARAAAQLYDQALEAIATARATDAALERFAVPEGSRSQTAPPARMRAVEGWGNLRWSKGDPAAVINRQTSPWYLDREELLVVTRRALCRFVLGDREGAVADLDRMLALDPADRALTERNLPSNYLRLRDGFRLGKLFATQEELALFAGPALIALVHAELAFETERWPEAVDAYRRVQERFGSRLSEDARAYLAFARACALLHQGRRDEARPLLQNFDGPKARWADTPTWPRGMIVLGDYIPRLDERITHLEGMLPHLGQSRHRSEVVLKIGQLAYVSRDYRKAVRAFSALRDASSEDSVMRRSATTYLDLIATLPRGVHP